MRYFLWVFILLVVGVVSVAGFRGGTTRRPPIEIFPDMDRQAKLRPQTWNNTFADRLSSQPPPVGTVARGTPYEDTPFHTGRVTGTTNFVELLPVPVTAQMLERGRQRFTINCSPCHGATGEGRGITTKYGMVNVANFHDKRLVAMPDGQIFNTITHGFNLMGAYGANVDISDRWAIIAYIRALERSALAKLDDVPEAQRAALKK